mgnify:CR=1 FL=1
MFMIEIAGVKVYMPYCCSADQDKLLTPFDNVVLRCCTRATIRAERIVT